MTFHKKGHAFIRSVPGFSRMYYRDLPLFALVDNLPQSRYEIPPRYVSIAGFVGRDRDRFAVDISSGCARSYHHQVRFIELEKGTPNRYTPESCFRKGPSLPSTHPDC